MALDSLWRAAGRVAERGDSVAQRRDWQGKGSRIDFKIYAIKAARLKSAVEWAAPKKESRRSGARLGCLPGREALNSVWHRARGSNR
jgi:hypothetical protein